MQRTGPDRVASTLGGLLVAALAAGCAPTGPPVDRDAEKRESFKHDMGPEKKWQESGLELPPYPDEANLMRAYITGLTNFIFLVDSQSISVREDGVVRYTLVARSSSGADNVSFEGMRCKKGDYKTYALGTTDKTWAAMTKPEWKPVNNPGINKYHYDLHRFYFCPSEIVPSGPGEVIAALKRGIPYPPTR